MPAFKRNKYNAIKTEIDGITFDSKKEGLWYLKLKHLQMLGQIKDLKLQVPFQLQPGFSITVPTDEVYKKTGERKTKQIKFRPTMYIADFVFYDIARMRIRVIDAKGMRTEGYLLKKKLFAYTFKNSGSFIEEKI